MNSGTERCSQSRTCFIHLRTVPLRLVPANSRLYSKTTKQRYDTLDELCMFSFHCLGSATRASYLMTSQPILLRLSLYLKIMRTQSSSSFPGKPLTLIRLSNFDPATDGHLSYHQLVKNQSVSFPPYRNRFQPSSSSSKPTGEAVDAPTGYQV